MNSNIFKPYETALQNTGQPSFSIKDEIMAYRNQLATMKQLEEEKKNKRDSGFLNRTWKTGVNVLSSVGEGIGKGLEGIGDAMATFSANVEKDQDMKDNLTRAIAYDRTGNNKVTQALDKYTQDSYMKDTWLEGAFGSVGEMLPSIALNAIPVAGQALSTASFVASASGRGTEQALQEGATLEQATKYGLTSGAVEGVIEMASGGIGGIGTGWLSKAFPKVASKVSTKLMTKPAIKVGLSMVGEGFEEVASELISPYMQRIYKNEEDIEPATMESIAQAFAIGAIASGILQGGSVALQGRANYKVQLINEQISNINDKIVNDTNKGTMTQEKAEIYQEQQEVLLQQLEETMGAKIEIKDTTTPQTTTETPTQEETTPQANVETIEQPIIEENKTQPLTEGLQETIQQEEVVKDLDTQLELIKTPEGKYNLRIKGTSILLQKKNGTQKHMEGLYNQFKEEGTVDMIVESMRNKATQQETVTQPIEQTTQQVTPQTTPLANVTPNTTQTQQATTKIPTNQPTTNIQNPYSQPQGQTVNTQDKVMTEMPKDKSTLNEKYQWARRKFTNAMNDIENFLKAKGVKNGEALSNKARTARSIAGNMVTNGIIEVEVNNGKIVKMTQKSEGLVKIFSFLNNKPESYKKDFFDYMLHRHNRSRMNLPFEVNADTNQIAVLHTALNNGEISQQLFNILTTPNQQTDIVTIRNLIYSHMNGMTQATLDTILDLTGDQKPVFGMNVTAQDSEVKVKEYDTKYPEFKAHASNIYKYNQALLDQQVKAGLIAQENADYFNTTYPDYVPTHRYQKGMNKSGIKQSEVQSGINTATGSDLVILPIDEQIFRQTNRVTQAMTLNPLLQELGKNAQDGTEVEVFKKERITNINQIDMNDTGNKNHFTYLQHGVDAKGQPTIERVTIKVSEGIAEGINSTLNEKQGALEEVLNKVKPFNSAFKKVTTSLNPFFSMLRNPLRDMQNALLFTKYDTKTFFKNFGKAVREMKSNGDLWKAYQANGGTYSSIYNFNEGSKKANPKGMGKFFNKVEQFSSFIEQAPRLAEFISSIEAGNTMEQAILDSADITVNFGRSGTVTRFVNGTFMPFFNAKMQGALKTIRAFQGYYSNRQWNKFGFLATRMALLGIGTAILNNFLYDDDEDYQNLRVEDKNNNYLIKIGNSFVKIPKAQMLGALSSVYNRSIEASKGDENAFDGLGKDLNTGFSPVESLRTIFSPFIDTKTNTTWYGGQIESSKFNNVRPRDRYDESTSSIAIAIGKTINYSPKKIHYLLDQYSGIIGDILLPVTSKKYTLDPVTKNIALDPTTSNKYSSRFYTLLEEAQYDKTDGDMVAKGKVRYLNKVKDSLSDLYQAQRDINNSDISNSDKKQEVKALQILINTTQQNAVESLKTFSDTLSKMELSDETFDDDYREATRLVFGAELALKNYNKNTYAKAQDLYAQGIDYDIFYCVYFDSKDLIGDFDFNGEYVKGSKQLQVWNYINKLNLSKTKKELLYEALGYKVKQESKPKDDNPFK